MTLRSLRAWRLLTSARSGAVRRGQVSSPPAQRRNPVPRGAAVTAALVALAALTGCGGAGSADEAGSAASGSPSPSATSPSGSPVPSPSQTPSLSPGPSIGHSPPPVSPPVQPSPTPSGPTLVVDGVAKQGVEAGCTILSGTDGRVWLLLGANGGTPDQKKIPLGVPLRVRGVQVDQIVSYCQQGTPLEVVDVIRR